ncbi:MAG: hypothetical protein FVQ80_00290 [Planctomycetes bacterium]|nr:hypothetical protein [Planctomycetota bacterium]
MKEAVSEIKKVAKNDSALAGEGVIELFIRLYPALMHIDSSSGALGTAMNKTIDSIMPILIKADKTSESSLFVHLRLALLN